jgi:hypothetical protein
MRVTADEETRTDSPEFLTGSLVVVAWITSDMGHIDREALAFPNEIPRQFGAEFRTVHIPVNTANCLKGPEAVQKLDSPEVTGVPYLVALGEVMKQGVVRKAMCVGKQPDSHSPSYRRARIGHP